MLEYFQSGVIVNYIYFDNISLSVQPLVNDNE